MKTTSKQNLLANKSSVCISAKLYRLLPALHPVQEQPEEVDGSIHMPIPLHRITYCILTQLYTVAFGAVISASSLCKHDSLWSAGRHSVLKQSGRIPSVCIQFRTNSHQQTRPCCMLLFHQMQGIAMQQLQWRQRSWQTYSARLSCTCPMRDVTCMQNNALVPHQPGCFQCLHRLGQYCANI